MIESAKASASFTANFEGPDEHREFVELRDNVLRDMQTRDEWLRRQAVWYAMRHDGLRRRNKPWPGSADLHFPLADSIIERLKPFYFNQLFATETIASFIAMREELASYTSDVGNWFDFKVKQESNLEREILIAIDQMLMAGIGVVKVYWEAGRQEGVSHEDTKARRGEGSREDAENGRNGSDQAKDWEDGAARGAGSSGHLAFDAVDPSKVIVPQWTQSLDEADRVTLVHTVSVEQFKRDPRFTQKNDEELKAITGKGHAQDGTNETLEQLAVRREGLTYATMEDEIVYWEVWEQTAEGWVVHWLSPMQPEPLRPSMRNPFKHGRLPIVRLEVEVKEKGHYSSRGIPERVGAFEAAICKLWNEKTDYMTLCNRPLFTTPAPIPNAGNLRLAPGQIIAGGLSAVQMPAPPVSFEEEMQQQRSAAELLVGMPDYGQGQEQNTNAPRTATEVQHISSLMNVSVDLRARTFRKALGELYGLAWQTLLQYDEGTRYLVGTEAKELDPAVLQSLAQDPEGLRVQPNGSADSWNRQGQLQKAIARKQLLGQSPWINQAELDKSILELDDPRLVKRLFQDPKERQADEYQAEAEEIPALMLGFPMQVKPGEDHATRIQCLAQFLEQRAQVGAAPDPIAIGAIQQHLQQHLAMLAQQNPKAAAQAQGMLKQIFARSVGGQNVNSGRNGMYGGQGGVRPPGPVNGGGMKAAGMPGQAAGGGAPVKESVSINYKDAPPSIRRQMEMAAGFRPAMDDPVAQEMNQTHAEMQQQAHEHALEMARGLREDVSSRSSGTETQRGEGGNL